MRSLTYLATKKTLSITGRKSRAILMKICFLLLNQAVERGVTGKTGVEARQDEAGADRQIILVVVAKCTVDEKDQPTGPSKMHRFMALRKNTAEETARKTTMVILLPCLPMRLVAILG